MELSSCSHLSASSNTSHTLKGVLSDEDVLLGEWNDWGTGVDRQEMAL